jgi:IMP dehydrogenase
LALGADTVMMGNFFARFSESPGRRFTMNGHAVKEYWMEASSKARNLKRYFQSRETFFEEGIGGYVPYQGSLYDAMPIAIQKLRAALSTAGARTIAELHRTAVLERQSEIALQDGQVHDMQVTEKDESVFIQPAL